VSAVKMVARGDPSGVAVDNDSPVSPRP